MSDTADTPEKSGEVSGFGEFLPASLLPLWYQYERVKSFRSQYGDTYTSVLEALVAIILTVGYLYWLYLFLIAS